MALFGHLLSIIISLIIWGAGYDIYPAQFGAIPIIPKDDGTFQHSLAWAAVTRDSTNNLWSEKLLTQATRSVQAMPIQLIYQSASNCLTKQNLNAIQELEILLMNNTDYIASICQYQSDLTCRPPRSIIRFFDGSYMGYNIIDSNGQNIFRPDPTFNRITEIISYAYDANGHSEKANVIAAGQPDLQVMLNYVVGSGKEFV